MTVIFNTVMSISHLSNLGCFCRKLLMAKRKVSILQLYLYNLSISDVFNYFIEHIHKPREFKGIDFEKGSPNLIVTRSGKNKGKMCLIVVLQITFN